MFYFLFFRIIPDFLTTFAIWHFVGQILMGHHEHSEESNYYTKYIENKNILVTPCDILSIYFGISTEPQEEPIGEEEDNGVHGDVNSTPPHAILDLDNALYDRHDWTNDGEKAHDLHALVDLYAEAACLRFIVIRIDHFWIFKNYNLL